MTAPFRPSPNGQPGYPQQQVSQQQMQPQFQQQPQQPQIPYTQNIMPEPAYTMPAPQFPVQQQAPQQPQYQQPQGPQYAPAWQGGQQLQQWQPAFPGQQPPQQQVQTQAPAQQIQVDAQGRMFGPGLPQALQGKTAVEAIRMYGELSQRVTQLQPQRQTPAPQAPVQPQQRVPQGNFFTDPEGSIRRIMDERLAPVIEQTQHQQITEARNQIAQQHPQFAQHESEVLQRLQGLPAETLANPMAWRLALQQVVGERAMAGQQQQQQPQVQQSNTLPWQTATTPSFFTESPSATMNGGINPGQQVGQLSPQQKEMARRFNISESDYLRGMGAGY